MTLDEYILKDRSTSEFIEDIYDGIMRHNADAAGISYWANEIDSENRTRSEVLEYFTNSDEFQSRVTAIIHARCYE